MTEWRQGLWIPVWVLGGVFASAGRGSWRAVAAVVVGALVGAVWQVLARRDPTDRLTWFAVGTLLLGLGLTLDPLLSGNTDPIDPGSALYLASVAAAVALTEQVLRRRELGPVTLDMVHAPDEVEGSGIDARDADRRSGA